MEWLKFFKIKNHTDKPYNDLLIWAKGDNSSFVAPSLDYPKCLSFPSLISVSLQRH